MVTLKLLINEDTVSVPAKTSYTEDGFYNGIYYFGEPQKPKNWKGYIKTKKSKKIQERMTNMVIKENDELVIRYVEVDSKTVPDSDGFMTDYTMYHKYTTTNKEFFDFIKTYKEGGYPDEWSDGYVFVLGDKELYSPYESDDFDYECESKQEAYEWFDDYNGFEDEDEDDFY